MADLYGVGFNTVMPQAKVITVMMQGVIPELSSLGRSQIHETKNQDHYCIYVYGIPGISSYVICLR